MKNAPPIPTAPKAIHNMPAILADRGSRRNLTSANRRGCRDRPRSCFTSPRRFFVAIRFSRAPAFGFVGRLFFGRVAACCEKRAQPRARGLPVLRLRSMLAAVDEQHVVRDHAVAGEIAQTLLHVVGQRRSADVEAQLDRRRHLVDVLPARSRGANEAFFYVFLVQHDRSHATIRPSTTVGGI